MTNNELFGLFCAFILGTIIIWDTFSRKKTVHVHNFFICPSGPILYEKEWWNGKIEDHEKVLRDIKKVEDMSPSELRDAQLNFPRNHRK